MFRDDNANPNADPLAGLRLQLEDFAPEALVETYTNLADALFIPSKDLCTFLNKAEYRNSKLKGKGVTTIRGPGFRKRRRDSTPPEQLSPDRERTFEDDQHRVSKRAAADDSSYKASSGSEPN